MRAINPVACCAGLTVLLGASLAAADTSSGTATSATSTNTSAIPLTPRSIAAIEGGCRLYADDAATATSDECLSCHANGTGTQLHNCHPVELSYPSSPPAMPPLRPLQDAVNRGALLPANLLRCVTCHDRSSPWDGAIALPPGATPLRGVVPGDATTYSPKASAPPKPGDRVTPTPLCLECHAYD